MAEENKEISISQDNPQIFNSSIKDLKDQVKNTKRGLEKSLSNTNGSVGIRYDGQTNLTAGNYSQIKLNPNGTVENFSLQNIN